MDIVFAQVFPEAPGDSVTLGETARTILGIPPEGWIPVFLSLLGILVTIVGVFITIVKLRSEIKNEKKKLLREDNAILLRQAKEYYSKLHLLLNMLINVINSTSVYSSKYALEFALDPKDANENNLFEPYIYREDDSVTRRIALYRTEIVQIYRDICEHKKNAPAYNTSIDSRMSELVTHMLQADEIDKNPELFNDYHLVCKTPFPTMKDLSELEKDIGELLNTATTDEQGK
jgi:hypothetical protein